MVSCLVSPFMTISTDINFHSLNTQFFNLLFCLLKPPFTILHTVYPLVIGNIYPQRFFLINGIIPFLPVFFTSLYKLFISLHIVWIKGIVCISFTFLLIKVINDYFVFHMNTYAKINRHWRGFCLFFFVDHDESHSPLPVSWQLALVLRLSRVKTVEL